MRFFQLALISFVVLFGAGSVRSQGVTRPECKCQNYGRFIMAGQTACIRTSKGPRMARCVMRGNVTDWDFLEEECDFVSMSAIPDPARTAIKSTTGPQ